MNLSPELINRLLASNTPVILYLDMDENLDRRAPFIRVVCKYSDGGKMGINQIDLRYVDRPDLVLKEFARTVKHQQQLLL